MSIEENKAILRRYVEEVLNEGYLDRLDELMDEDFVDHSPIPGQPPGMAGVIQGLALLRIAFPDVEVVYEDMVAEADRVASRYRVTGTHRGQFLGISPTGRPVSWSGMNIIRFSDGLMVEGWDVEDSLGLMQQLEEGSP